MTERIGAIWKAQASILSGQRLHLHEGPIDLLIGAEGPCHSIKTAYRLATERFNGLLKRVSSQLDLLRRPITAETTTLPESVAERMISAVRLFLPEFVTPMAAVAGSVADEICNAACGAEGIRKIYVNNGGDIAFQLYTAEQLTVGLVPSLAKIELSGKIKINENMPVRGIATSGMNGRSYSLGIADAVTVLAKNAAIADTAATLIANKVNIDHPAIERSPAVSLDPDSDLIDKLVTVRRGKLPEKAIITALSNGEVYAKQLIEHGIISAAYLACAGYFRTTDTTRHQISP